jgi:hypothetical protein
VKRFAIEALCPVIACMVVLSCASYKPVQPASPDYYSLKTGDILWVHTGMVTRYRVHFRKIAGDSLLADPRSFLIDSVTRIEKESYSATDTNLLLGSVGVVGFVATLWIIQQALSAYESMFTIFTLF